jgi:hypothetical protein
MESIWSVIWTGICKWYARYWIEDTVMTVTVLITVFHHLTKIILHLGLDKYCYSWDRYKWLYDGALSIRYSYLIFFAQILLFIVWHYYRMIELSK